MTAPRISDHALVRFLSRAGELDVERLRAQLAQSLARAHGAARAAGGGNYLILADGLVYVVRGDTVTTVLVDDARGTARRRHHAAILDR